MTQLRVLFLLREDQGMTARALAESLSVTPSTLTRIMDRLVHSQLVQREEDREDRRLVRHYLTPTALGMVSELERTGRERMGKVLNRLSPDQLDRLVEALRDFAAAAEEVEAEEAPEAVKV
jgi:DNA-binding MarR family transcriptional regulator